MSKTNEGFLLIADITGYTQYLSESELEHAQETLTALLELLVENTGPPLVISRLAGDAVISYGLQENFFQGQPFVEKIADTYVTFRKAIQRLVLNNTCQCKACANISNLDLKFFIHYGTFGLQRISDHYELVGSDINLLHRLLKNRVTEATRVRAYALYTEGALQQLDLEGLAEAMTPHQESYEHLGEVKVWIHDMHPVWEKKRESTAVKFPNENIWSRIDVDLDMPRERAWDYLIRPEYRNSLIGSNRMELANRSNGLIAPGSVYQCYHGDKLVPQTILEWEPFKRMIVKEVSPMSPATGGIAEYRLDSIKGGTKLTKTMARPFGPFLGRLMLNLMQPVIKHVLQQAFEKFKSEIEAVYQPHLEAPRSPAAFTEEQVRAAAAASLSDSSTSRPS